MRCFVPGIRTPELAREPDTAFAAMARQASCDDGG